MIYKLLLVGMTSGTLAATGAGAGDIHDRMYCYGEHRPSVMHLQCFSDTFGTLYVNVREDAGTTRIEMRSWDAGWH